MFLKKIQVPPATTDRSAIGEAAALGATPGQKLLSWGTAILAMLIIVGGVGYRYLAPIIKGEEPAKQAATTQKTATAAPQSLNVPLSFSPAEDPAPAGDNSLFPPSPQAAPAPAQPSGQVAATPGLIGANMQTSEPASQHGAATPIDGDVDKALQRKLGGDFGFRQVQATQDDLAPGKAVLAPASVSGNAPPSNGQLGLGGASGPEAAGNKLQGMLVGTSTPSAAAGYITNQNLTMAKGTQITCTLDTAIQTDQPGMVSCLTDYPVRSMNGKVILMERGTKIEGEYQKGVEQGMKAIFVLWTRARTPLGVVVNLSSPGTDALGRAGISGQVDTKFWERFGGALAFSLFQDGSTVIASRLSKESSTGNTNGSAGGLVVLPNTQGTTQTAVSEILKQGSDIRPSMYKNQGESVGITVARDIDFSNVYKLVMVR